MVLISELQCLINNYYDINLHDDQQLVNVGYVCQYEELQFIPLFFTLFFFLFT